MRALVQRLYGEPADVLTIEDIPPPRPAEDEVLVRVHAASLHPDVWHVVTGRPAVLRLMGAGVRRPRVRVPGTDMAGRVEAVGAAVTRFRIGDDVFGETTKKLQWANAGAFAQLAAAPELALAHKPANVSFEQAASVPSSGTIALAQLPRRHLGPGQHVLVNGAGGGVGAFAVQIAKASGATVTAVDLADKLDMLRTLGADHVIDGEREDFTAGGARYDFVLDIPGNRPFTAVRRALRPGGEYVLVGHDQYGAHGRRWLGSIPRAFRLIALSPFVSELPRPDFAEPDKTALMETLRAMLEAGTLTPVVDRSFPLDEFQDAFRYLASGRVRGKIVLTF